MLNKTKQKQTNKHTIIEKIVREKHIYIGSPPQKYSPNKLMFFK